MINNLVDFYKKEALNQRRTLPWLAAIQEKALEEFAYRAFPTRQDEEWKYTVLDAFLNQRFTIAQEQEPAPQKLGAYPSKTPIGSEVVIYNGEIHALEDLQNSLPSGLIVEPLEQALGKHEEKIRPWLGKLLQNEHGFHALNMANLQTGLFIYVPAGVQLDAPLVLAHWQDKPQTALHARHLLILEEGSSLCLIETYQGKSTESYLTNVVTEAYLAPKAKLQHYKIQEESRSAFHISHLAVQQSQNSFFESHSLSLGSQLARMDLSVKFLAKNARCLLNGMYLPCDNQHIDHHTSIHHLQPDCQSRQDYKGILLGKSRAVFNGKVFVGKGAVHTEASQENKNILLSSSAEVDTKPQLDIFADDVICSHGATVGQLDPEALFYLASRGLNPEEAKAFLIQAFVASNLSLIPHKEMRDWMTTLINNQLELG